MLLPLFFLSLISIISLFVSSHTILFASNRECRFGDQLTLQFWRFVVEIRSNLFFFNFVFPLQIVICRMFGRDGLQCLHMRSIISRLPALA